MKYTALSIIIAGGMIAGTIFLINGNSVKGPVQVVNANNVSVVGGQQVVEIRAKGGFLPRISVAKAGIPTVVRFDTNGTFDCSSSVRIPSLNITKVLPPNGSTDIDIGTQQVSSLQGTCGMGMYPFEIDFKS
ncbi:MAG: cupredoxin domain-containing protein [Minisyncoccia bacterium]